MDKRNVVYAILWVYLGLCLFAGLCLASLSPGSVSTIFLPLQKFFTKFLGPFNMYFMLLQDTRIFSRPYGNSSSFTIRGCYIIALGLQAFCIIPISSVLPSRMNLSCFAQTVPVQWCLLIGCLVACVLLTSAPSQCSCSLVCSTIKLCYMHRHFCCGAPPAVHFLLAE